jgi:arsenical pump membrane protein
MTAVGASVIALLPALAFLVAAVPLAVLLDDDGFFAAAAGLVAGRRTSVAGLWLLAAVTTVVLNLDTTVVLLTPLYLRLARSRAADPAALAAIPLLLASLASSALPVSNLTTLIAAEQLSLGVGEVALHLGPPTLAAVAVGWWAYRRRFPTHLEPAPAGTTEPVDGAALRRGGLVVAGLLVGFIVGPMVGVSEWVVALAADGVLVVLVGRFPWRALPLATAAGVAVVAAVVGWLVPPSTLAGVLTGAGPGGLVVAAPGGAAAPNLVNNLPALLAALRAADGVSPPFWLWLLGVNAAAVLLPVGALANLLWWRIVRADGVALPLRRYVGLTVPVALPAFAAAVAVAVALAAWHPA